MSNKKTLVLGASPDPSRYSYLAIKKLRENGHETIAIGRHTGTVADVKIGLSEIPIAGLHTVTLYLNPLHQQSYYNYILSLYPKRIIFNPGAENAELAKLANQQGIITQDACTLVLLSTGQY